MSIQPHTEDVETKEEKIDKKWLDLLNHQMNFCLGLITHATTLKCVNEVIKASVLAHLGRVMANAKKGYEGFQEICVNIRQTPFTVPPGFARVEYKFTDVQLRNHLARKKSRQLEDANAKWLEFLEGDIPKRKTKNNENSKNVAENKMPTKSKKRKRTSKTPESAKPSGVAKVDKMPKGKALKIKVSHPKKSTKAATAPKATTAVAVASQPDPQASLVDLDYQALLREHQLAQQKKKKKQYWKTN